MKVCRLRYGKRSSRPEGKENKLTYQLKVEMEIVRQKKTWKHLIVHWVGEGGQIWSWVIYCSDWFLFDPHLGLNCEGPPALTPYGGRWRRICQLPDSFQIARHFFSRWTDSKWKLYLSYRTLSHKRQICLHWSVNHKLKTVWRDEWFPLTIYKNKLASNVFDFLTKSINKHFSRKEKKIEGDTYIFDPC